MQFNYHMRAAWYGASISIKDIAQQYVKKNRNVSQNWATLLHMNTLKTLLDE